MLLTDPEQAADFVKQNQCDALAIAIGTSHGAYKFTRKPTGDILAIERIKEIHARIPNTHLVMHGSSSVPQDLLKNNPRQRRRHEGNLWRAGRGNPTRHQARRAQNQYRYRHSLSHDRGDPQIHGGKHKASSIRATISKPATAAAKEICKQRYEQFGSAGQASKIKPLALEKMAQRYTGGELRQVVN